MLRRIGVFFIFILIIGIGIAGYLFLPVKTPETILGNIPASEPHQHATPDGELIEHIHTHDPSVGSDRLLYEPNAAKNSGDEKTPDST